MINRDTICKIDSITLNEMIIMENPFVIIYGHIKSSTYDRFSEKYKYEVTLVYVYKEAKYGKLLSNAEYHIVYGKNEKDMLCELTKIAEESLSMMIDTKEVLKKHCEITFNNELVADYKIRE